MPKICKSSVLSGYGLTSSSQVSGPTGSVGGPGISGNPGTPPAKITLLCLEDIGFFKKGEFYDVQLIGGFIISKDGLSAETRKFSIDAKIVSIKEIEEKCIWGDKLRDYKLQEILNGTV